MKLTPLLRLGILVIILDLLGAMGVAVSIYNGTVIGNLSRENVTLVRAAQQSAVQSAAQKKLTQNFLSEINYICSFDAARADQIGSPLPPAPPGLCTLTAAP